MGRMGPWLRKGTSASGPSRPTSQQEAASRGSPILFGHLSGEGSTSRGARVGGSREADLSELMPGRSWADRGVVVPSSWRQAVSLPPFWWQVTFSWVQVEWLSQTLGFCRNLGTRAPPVLGLLKEELMRPSR